MNHRLKLRWDEIRGLHLTGVWCPADHGGECNCPEVEEDEDHIEPVIEDYCADHTFAGIHRSRESACPGCVTYLAAFDRWEQGDHYVPTGRCWAKENLDEFATATGWGEVIEGDIDLPWVAVTINGPGVDGNDPLTVKVVAEVKVTGDE